MVLVIDLAPGDRSPSVLVQAGKGSWRPGWQSGVGKGSCVEPC